jgi:hypothetical protein
MITPVPFSKGKQHLAYPTTNEDQEENTVDPNTNPCGTPEITFLPPGRRSVEDNS